VRIDDNWRIGRAPGGFAASPRKPHTQGRWRKISSGEGSRKTVIPPGPPQTPKKIAFLMGSHILREDRDDCMYEVNDILDKIRTEFYALLEYDPELVSSKSREARRREVACLISELKRLAENN
jgi:hypothetical protein